MGPAIDTLGAIVAEGAQAAGLAGPPRTVVSPMSIIVAHNAGKIMRQMTQFYPSELQS